MAALIKYNVMKGTFYRGGEEGKEKKNLLKTDLGPNEPHFHINS